MTEEERAEDFSAGESGHYEGDEETKDNDEILPGMPQRQSCGKRVLGAPPKCGATSGVDGDWNWTSCRTNGKR